MLYLQKLLYRVKIEFILCTKATLNSLNRIRFMHKNYVKELNVFLTGDSHIEFSGSVDVVPHPEVCRLRRRLPGRERSSRVQSRIQPSPQRTRRIRKAR